eukprot:351133-Chlamydomonas_euryale.AAC.5
MQAIFACRTGVFLTTPVRQRHACAGPDPFPEATGGEGEALGAASPDVRGPRPSACHASLTPCV